MSRAKVKAYPDAMRCGMDGCKRKVTTLNFCPSGLSSHTYQTCDEHLELYRGVEATNERYETLLYPGIDEERDVAIECALLVLASLRVEYERRAA